MYEESTRTKLEINWKSLLIKMSIVLVALFIILWLISLVNKDKNEVKESNISTNLQIMVDGALDYFKDSRLPQTINGKKKVTLGDMVDLNLITEFKDQNGDYCDNNSSYAEATKVNSTDYTIKVKLVCGDESDYIIKTIQSYSNADNVNSDINSNVQNDNTTNNNANNNSNNNTTTNNNQNNNITKPNTSTTTKPSTNTTTKPSTNTTTKPSTTTKPNVTNICTYGKKEYSVSYPLAYVISGDCAVSKTVLNYATHSNAASSIGAKEYKKLVLETQELINKTGADLDVESPKYIEVQNKDKKGYVGYQIKFVVKQNNKIIYEYYLDTNGNRTVITDLRNNIYKNQQVTSISINSSNIKLYEGEYKYLDVTIKPNNATSKDITWTSSNKSIVKVNSNGKITALKEGKAYITATVNGVSDKILVTVYENETYTYCKRVEERIYSTGFAGKSDIENKTSLDYGYILEFTRNNISNVSIIDYGNLENTTSEYKKAYNYLKGYYVDKPIDIVANNSGVDPLNYTNLMKHSLKNYNMTPTVTFNSKNATYWYFNVNIRLNNLNNIREAEKFYTSDSYWVYFVPLYFDIEYADLTRCVEVNSNELYDYKYNKNYIKVN